MQVRRCSVVCSLWQRIAAEAILNDTAASRPRRCVLLVPAPQPVSSVAAWLPPVAPVAVAGCMHPHSCHCPCYWFATLQWELLRGDEKCGRWDAGVPMWMTIATGPGQWQVTLPLRPSSAVKWSAKRVSKKCAVDSAAQGLLVRPCCAWLGAPAQIHAAR